jgi:hypothetical protein
MDILKGNANKSFAVKNKKDPDPANH